MTARLIAAACEHYKITLSSFKSRSRDRMAVRARHAVAYVLRHRDGKSYPWIAREIGRKDHTTIINACECAAALIESDPVFCGLVSRMMDMPRCGVAERIAEPKVEQALPETPEQAAQRRLEQVQRQKAERIAMRHLEIAASLDRELPDVEDADPEYVPDRFCVLNSAGNTDPEHYQLRQQKFAGRKLAARILSLRPHGHARIPQPQVQHQGG